METIQIFGFLFLIILLEVTTDAFHYLSNTPKTKTWYGPFHHITQLISIPVIFLFGYFYTNSIWNEKTLYLIVVYTMLRFALFDLGYNWITGNTIIGTTSLWDKFLNKLLNSDNPFSNIIGKILIHTVIRMLIAFIAVIILTYTFN